MKKENETKIIGLGLSKTGTSSLSDALNYLGIYTIHYPYDETTLHQLKSADYRLILFETYQGVVDLPLVQYYPQLDKIYPNSKFILTIRDIDEWLVSAEKHWELMMIWQENNPSFKKFHEFVSTSVFGCLKFNYNRFRYIYETHLSNVRNFFRNREEDLLEINICKGEGWEKLCPFLQLPIPKIPFPHSNEWMHKLITATTEMRQLIPLNSPFILIDQECMGEEFSMGRNKIHFSELQGKYNGMPSNDEMALLELTKNLQIAEFLIIAWPSYWLFDYYPNLTQEIFKHQCILKNDRLTIFKLNK